jgi:hypothetical protein
MGVYFPQGRERGEEGREGRKEIQIFSHCFKYKAAGGRRLVIKES